MYQTLRDSVAPLKLKKKSVDKIIQMLTKHFDPKPSLIVQRFRFTSPSHQEGESVAKFTAELQWLSEYCKFGVVLSDMLRDKLVVGITNERIQRQLSAEKELTFKKVYELPIAQETTENNTAEAKAEGSNEYAWQPRRRVRTSVTEAACTPAR